MVSMKDVYKRQGFSWQYGSQLETAITEEEVIGYWYNADGIRTKKIRSNGEVTDYYFCLLYTARCV